MTYKYQNCPSCFELSVAEEASCPFCGYNLTAVNYHPWRRFLARSFDIALFYVVWTILMLSVFFSLEPSTEATNFLDNNQALFNHPLLNILFNALILITTETILLRLFGNTPGKKLYRIRLHHASGKKPRLKDAFNRTLMMYLVGLGFLIPILNFYAVYLARKRLIKTGTTLWDIRSDFYLYYKVLSRWYSLGVFTLHFLVLLLFTAILSSQQS